MNNNLFFNYLYCKYTKNAYDTNSSSNNSNVIVDEKYLMLRDFYIKYTKDHNKTFNKYSAFKFVHNLTHDDVVNCICAHEGNDDDISNEDDLQVKMYKLYKRNVISKDDFVNNIHNPECYFNKQIPFNTFNKVFHHKTKAQTENMLNTITTYIQHKKFDYEYYQHLYKQCKVNIILNFFKQKINKV